VFSIAGKELFLQTEKESEKDNETSENSKDTETKGQKLKARQPKKDGG